MMTKEELIALVELVNRIPMTAAERLFVQALVHKLEQQILEQIEKSKSLPDNKKA